MRTPAGHIIERHHNETVFISQFFPNSTSQVLTHEISIYVYHQTLLSTGRTKIVGNKTFLDELRNILFSDYALQFKLNAGH
jgi:hypothetical protein